MTPRGRAGLGRERKGKRILRAFRRQEHCGSARWLLGRGKGRGDAAFRALGSGKIGPLFEHLANGTGRGGEGKKKKKKGYAGI